LKLALVIGSLGGGGAERVMATLANAWAAHAVDVTLITLHSRDHDKYTVSPAVARVELCKAGRSRNVLHALANNCSRIRRLRRAIVACKPDVVISFVDRTNMLTIIATAGLRLPVIVAEHTFAGAFALKGIWGRLQGPLYRRAETVVALTGRGASCIENKFGCGVTVIPNPVPFPRETEASAVPDSASGPRDRGRRTLLAVGRLVPLKGFDLLIEAFAQLAGLYPDWDLRILGEGDFRDALLQKAAALHISHRVSMPGFVSDVRANMRQSDLFALSSRYEGFPMALLEAMAEGLACVSFDCETGPRELIRHGENGWLVPANDVSALAEALGTLMQDADLRQHLGVRAREVTKIYSLPAVLDKWNALIKTVAFPDMGQREPRNAIRSPANRNS
jgi:glycosyltransferase involved in cell wall biosynthesis